MGVHRGANLVGMSLLLLDVCPLSWFTEKEKKKQVLISWIDFILFFDKKLNWIYEYTFYNLL